MMHETRPVGEVDLEPSLEDEEQSSVLSAGTASLRVDVRRR
jgi:hypothetical protein